MANQHSHKSRPALSSEPSETLKTKDIWRYIINTMRPFPLGFSIMVWTAVIWAIEMSLKPYLLKVILNKVSLNNQEDVFSDLALPIALYLLVYLTLTTSFRLYGYVVEIKMIPQMRKKVANDAFSRILEKSHDFFQNNFAGSLTNKINDLTRSVPDLWQIVMDRFFSHTLCLCVAIFTLAQVSAIFAVAMFLWSTFFIIVSYFLSKKLAHHADDWSERGSIIVGNIVDALSNMLSVRLFTAANKEKETLSRLVDDAVVAEEKMQWSYLLMWGVYGYTFFILQIVNFYYLCKGRQEGWVTVGDFALVFVINISIVEFLWQLTKDFSQFSKLYGTIIQAFRTVHDPDEITSPPDAPSLNLRSADVVFEGVSFHYTGAEALFKNKSVVIPAGQKVGLVGYSGSGKSTFVNLILRLFDVTGGRILLGGQDIRGVSQDSLRAHIALIPQDPTLFHRSLLENIRYGCINASDTAVVEAAKRAHADTFIRALPGGYGALVGERGVKLSGGQRQRIAIARAILKDAPLLILDEATSQLDSVTEGEIQSSLWALMQGKTTLVIAHRLSTLLHMDRILVFDGGRIVQDGPHKTLVSKDGLYKTLWDAQVGGFLGDGDNAGNG